jgi:selenocysteine lyase/cysteine desulfurase
LNNTPNDALGRYKEAFHHHESLIHLNNAGVGPVCRPSRDAIYHWVNRYYEEGFHANLEANPFTETTRELLADVLGAKTTEVAFSNTASASISQIAFGIGLKPGDEVLIWDQEYTSNFNPWKIASEKAGAKLVILPSGPGLSTPTKTVQNAITPKTRVIAFSWVQYRTGAISDFKAIADLARPLGIFTCCDIIQGAGVLPFNFHASNLDAACGGSQKWFCAGPSVGYLLIREEHISKFQPLLVGAMSAGGADSLAGDRFEFRPGALRFEPGTKSIFDLVSFGAALQLTKETGIERIAQEAEWLTRLLMHGLRERGYLINSPHGAHHRGTFVSISPGPDSRFKSPDEISKQLFKNGVSHGVRPPGVRFSPHAFNSENEMNRVLSYL